MNAMLRRVMRARLSAVQQRWSRALERGTLPRFSNEPEGFEMRLPRSLVHPELMTIGRDVKIGPYSQLKCSTGYPGGWMRHPAGNHVVQEFTPRLTIGDRVTATASLQVAAFLSIDIEDDVMFAANVFVADGTHALTTTDVPYKYQGLGKLGPVRIGRGAWIGQNAVILPGVTIGEMAVIAANSVISHDVAARTIVGGVPARVLKCWDDRVGQWSQPELEGG